MGKFGPAQLVDAVSNKTGILCTALLCIIPVGYVIGGSLLLAAPIFGAHKGRVVDARTGNGIANVAVLATIQDGVSFSSFSTQSDFNGRFDLPSHWAALWPQWHPLREAYGGIPALFGPAGHSPSRHSVERRLKISIFAPGFVASGDLPTIESVSRLPAPGTGIASDLVNLFPSSEPATYDHVVAMHARELNLRATIIYHAAMLAHGPDPLGDALRKVESTALVAQLCSTPGDLELDELEATAMMALQRRIWPSPHGTGEEWIEPRLRRYTAKSFCGILQDNT